MMKYIPQDKGTHYFYNQLVAVVAYLLLLIMNIPNPVLVSIAFGIGVGLAVELYQRKTGTGVCDIRDWAWGSAGVVVGFVPLLAAGFLV